MRWSDFAMIFRRSWRYVSDQHMWTNSCVSSFCVCSWMTGRLTTHIFNIFSWRSSYSASGPVIHTPSVMLLKETCFIVSRSVLSLRIVRLSLGHTWRSEWRRTLSAQRYCSHVTDASSSVDDLEGKCENRRDGKVIWSSVKHLTTYQDVAFRSSADILKTTSVMKWHCVSSLIRKYFRTTLCVILKVSVHSVCLN